jgi:hypothetical protein
MGIKQLIQLARPNWPLAPTDKCQYVQYGSTESRSGDSRAESRRKGLFWPHPRIAFARLAACAAGVGVVAVVVGGWKRRRAPPRGAAPRGHVPRRLIHNPPHYTSEARGSYAAAAAQRPGCGTVKPSDDFNRAKFLVINKRTTKRPN